MEVRKDGRKEGRIQSNDQNCNTDNCARECENDVDGGWKRIKAEIMYEIMYLGEVEIQYISLVMSSNGNSCYCCCKLRCRLASQSIIKCRNDCCSIIFSLAA